MFTSEKQTKEWRYKMRGKINLRYHHVVVFIFALCCISSCDVHKDEDGDPVYQTKIAWDSGLYSNSYGQHMVDEDSVFFYERPPGYKTANIYALTRLDAATGAFIWRSTVLFDWIVFCQPVAIGGYVYVFLRPNVILCFDRETGECTAKVRVDIDNKKLEFRQFATAYQDYLYLGLGMNGNYFVRFDATLIDQGGDTDMQDITPEVLWEPETKRYVQSKPVIYNNTVYTGTYTPTFSAPIELAGFDIDSGLKVFHTTFGGSEDTAAYVGNIRYPEDIRFPENGCRDNPIYIHDNILYYLSYSINAWDLNTGERLYRHVVTYNIPMPEVFTADTLQAVYYKGNIHYTGNSGGGELRNIRCINAATGKLVWSAALKTGETLDTNPVIAHGKLYVCAFDGLYVFRPEDGELLGIDKSFWGAGRGRNVLYKDYMLCIRKDDDSDGKLVAVYVGE
jgi:outer membrane protein assembly factor BamB